MAKGAANAFFGWLGAGHLSMPPHKDQSHSQPPADTAASPGCNCEGKDKTPATDGGSAKDHPAPTDGGPANDHQSPADAREAMDAPPDAGTDGKRFAPVDSSLPPPPSEASESNEAIMEAYLTMNFSDSAAAASWLEHQFDSAGDRRGMDGSLSGRTPRVAPERAHRRTLAASPKGPVADR
jgi:hypothetical protein